MKAALTWMSLFVLAAGVWLAIMENPLKHAGYGLRMAVAACIATQGLLTVLLLVLNGRSVLRAVVLTGGLGSVFLGAFALRRILDSRHFEGFVLLIGSALIVHCLLKVTVFLRDRHATTL